MDISITAANVLPSAGATLRRYTAGAAITAGQMLYLDPATKTVKLADANGASPLFNVRGIAGNNAAVGQPVEVVISDPDLAIGGTIAAGAVLVLSATPGGVAPVADLATGHKVTVLGVGVGTNKVFFNPFASGATVP